MTNVLSRSWSCCQSPVWPVTRTPEPGHCIIACCSPERSEMLQMAWHSLIPARVSVFIFTLIKSDDEEGLSRNGVLWRGAVKLSVFIRLCFSPNYKIHASWVQPPLISLASTGQHCLLWGLLSDSVIILESWSEWSCKNYKLYLALWQHPWPDSFSRFLSQSIYWDNFNV